MGFLLLRGSLRGGCSVICSKESSTWVERALMPPPGYSTEVSSVPLQQTLRHLNAAFTNFFTGRAAYPTFKRKRKGQSATDTDNAFTWRDGKLTLAKHDEPLDIVWSRPLPQGARISRVTITKDPSGRYFISLLVVEKAGFLYRVSDVLYSCWLASKSRLPGVFWCREEITCLKMRSARMQNMAVFRTYHY